MLSDIFHKVIILQGVFRPLLPILSPHIFSFLSFATFIWPLNLQVRSTAQPREIDPQPRGPKGRLYPPLSFQHLVQFNLPNVPYGARLLEPQVGELSWDRAPPEVVDDAGDKQPG